MIEKILIEFIDFLNKNEFNINVSKIFNFINMMNNEDISFANYDDVLGLMKISFCTNQDENNNIEKLFKKFLNNYEELQEINKQIKKNQKNLSDLTETEKNTENEFKKFLEKANTDKEALTKHFEEQKKELIKQYEEDLKNSPLNKKDLDFLKKNEKDLKKLKLSSKNKNTNKNILDNKLEETSKESIDDLLKEVMDYAKKCILKNDINSFDLANKYFSILEKVQKFKNTEKKELNEKLKNLEEEKVKEKKKIDEEIEKERKKTKEIQKKINILLSSKKNLEDKMILKEKSLQNRLEFINGKNSVVTTKQKLDKVFEKNFKQLSLEDKKKIIHYINKNILKFKTKLAKNIRTENKNKIDISETIKNACKTGGLPINIFYEKPKASKPNMVLILDVSGSCKEASEMMLTFMYLLQDVFKGGCKTFAFVDTLYDISDIMKSKNIEESIETVLNTIPRKGVYSNYYKPLKTLWCDKNKCINKDSIVIFIGDARNNSNPDGINYLNNICRKAKKSYWLNTESYSKWGIKDSLAFKYNRIIKMYETLNTSDLIYFLNNF